jgi:hypothetical protein
MRKLKCGCVLRCWVTVGVLCVLTIAGKSQGTSSVNLGPAAPLIPVLQRLREETKVPLRLPSFIPFSDDLDTPLYSSISYMNDTSYDIELSWSQDCSGGNSCHFGSIHGSKESQKNRKIIQFNVDLKPGLKGYFSPATCGGTGCTDAVLAWMENGYNYSVTMKAGKKEEMVRMAKSAIGR